MLKEKRVVKPRPKREIKIKAVRRKEIDFKLLARAYFEEGLRQARERPEAELPPRELTLERLAEIKRMHPQFYDFFRREYNRKLAERRRQAKLKTSASLPDTVARLQRQILEAQEQLRQLGINSDGESPQPPGPAAHAPQGP